MVSSSFPLSSTYIAVLIANVLFCEISGMAFSVNGEARNNRILSNYLYIVLPDVPIFRTSSERTLYMQPSVH